jgi:hypothetical protein
MSQIPADIENRQRQRPIRRKEGAPRRHESGGRSLFREEHLHVSRAANPTDVGRALPYSLLPDRRWSPGIRESARSARRRSPTRERWSKPPRRPNSQPPAGSAQRSLVPRSANWEPHEPWRPQPAILVETFRPAPPPRRPKPGTDTTGQVDDRGHETDSGSRLRRKSRASRISDGVKVLKAVLAAWTRRTPPHQLQVVESPRPRRRPVHQPGDLCCLCIPLICCHVITSTHRRWNRSLWRSFAQAALS